MADDARNDDADPAAPPTLSGHLATPGTFTRWVGTHLRVPPGEVVGCTEAEIADVDAAAGRPLPAAYRQFLQEGGKVVGSGWVADHFSRSSLVYPRVLNVRDVALEMLDDLKEAAGDPTIVQRAFPFYNWEGYLIRLLDLTGGDDPPVLLIDEETGEARVEFDTFSAFMRSEVGPLADVIRRLREFPQS
jgi:hypothetical protein